MNAIKGSLFQEYVRIIRANKNRDWGKYLTKEDLNLVQSDIYPHKWYPLESYERIGYAIFKELGGGKLESAWQWGRFAGEDIANRFYQHLIRAQDPITALMRCQQFVQQWYQFDDPEYKPVELLKISDTNVKAKIKYKYPSEGFEPYVHQVAGTFERLIELNGGKEVRVIVSEKNLGVKEPSAVIEISWK